MERPTDSSTLKASRDWLRDQLDEGATCPCCTQFAKVYRRKLNATMVRALVLLHRAGGEGQYVHGPTVLRGSGVFGGEVGKLALWSLVAEERARRTDGGRSGWWMVTPDGVNFLSRAKYVYKYARVYNGRLLGFDGPVVTVDDALGKKFRLDELMAGV